MCVERLEQILREREPPCTPTPRYEWPTKLLMRPQSQAVEVKMVKLQEKPKPLDMALKSIGNSAVVMNTPREAPKNLRLVPGPPEVKTLDPECVANVADNDPVPEPPVEIQPQTNCSTPVQRLEAEYARVMRVSAEEPDLEPALRDQLIMLPAIEELTPECNIDEANVGVPGVTTLEMEAKMRNAILLKAELIEHSESEWSSPNVIVLKKNGIDIRMCIDYRLLNLLIKLSRYPLPLIDDLLVDFKSAMWFMSLDMASGFWALRMTDRARLISAFVCPFGPFQWLRMTFRLKNATLIYQSIINNCLW
ncbi:reverse transcriptase [Phytophthora megakarya]|uniref:Reverse transcriptase n=1 Tax=Phytophthora megakarya TaxID=4795 RepID=A0A225V9Z3_9STRA|nr:reverse transcriptase [Phytophthora megakarya]